MTGVLTRTIGDLEDRGHLKVADVANIIDVSTTAVSRWRAGMEIPRPSTQLVISDLRYVVERLSDIYAPAQTRRWLYAKSALFDGERAVDLIYQGKTEAVLAAVDRLDSGAFV